MRGSRILQDRVLSHEHIQVRFETEVEELLGAEKLSSVVLKDRASGLSEAIPAAGLFIAIGHLPRSDLFSSYLSLDELGYILPKGGPHGATATEVEGVFVAGDVADHRYRQAITAAGSGAAAALDATAFLLA